jgi:hypothetical protein
MEVVRNNVGQNGVVDSIDVAALPEQINRRIDHLFDRGHQIGHAYFLGVNSLKDSISVGGFSLTNFRKPQSSSRQSNANGMADESDGISCPQTCDLRPFVSSARTVSFSIDYVTFAGFWAGRFNNGQAGSVIAASPTARWHDETSHKPDFLPGMTSG